MAFLQSSSVQGVTYGTNWVGMICAFGTGSTPTDWLVCNGASISRSTYADLFAVIGTSWGGSGNSFNVPEMRGEFIRGWPNGCNRDQDLNRAIGSHQNQCILQGGTHNCVQYMAHTGGGMQAPEPGWAFMQFKHPGYPNAHGGNPPNGTLAQSLGFYWVSVGIGYNHHKVRYGNDGIGTSRNQAVNFCIKY